MKQVKGFSRENVYKEAERLPAGGYVLKVLDVKYMEYDWGDQIVLYFDIIEGEHKDHFKNNYQDQTGEDKKWKGAYRLNVPKDDGSEKDEWSVKRFNTTIVAFEESNPGYHWDWDEGTLKGKVVGSVFNNKEFELDNGQRGFYTNCHHLVSADLIQKGAYKSPADTLLKKGVAANTQAVSDDGFLNIPDGVEDEQMPFN